MENKSKQMSDYSDRELLEKIVTRSKEAADAAKWVKSYIVVSSIIALVLFILSQF